MNTNGSLYPYLERTKLLKEAEKQIEFAISGGKSQAILLLGKGGVGKTFFIRHLAEKSSQENILWLGPYDMDDVKFGLLFDLNDNVAMKLDRDRRFFSNYYRFL